MRILVFILCLILLMAAIPTVAMAQYVPYATVQSYGSSNSNDEYARQQQEQMRERQEEQQRQMDQIQRQQQRVQYVPYYNSNPPPSVYR